MPQDETDIVEAVHKSLQVVLLSLMTAALLWRCSTYVSSQPLANDDLYQSPTYYPR